MGTNQANHILIRFGELSTKKKNRRLFVRTLMTSIRKRCIHFPTLQLKDQFDRILLILNDEPMDPVLQALGDVFGIASYTPVFICESTLEAITQTAFQQMKDLEPSTFKVESRRKVKTFPFNSMDVNRAVASLILSQTQHRVDIHHPQISIRVEVGAHETHIGVKTYQGRLGMPVGVGGKALVLMSGGIDSPVAAYMMMKRGVEIECVHFTTPPFTSEQALQKVKDLIQQLTRFQAEIPLHIVNFTDVQVEMYRPIDKRYGITLMRRGFVRIANRIAKERKALALVTGDSIGQVASQTIESLGTIEEASSIPVLRPLLTYDKMEIIQWAKTLNTYPISILPYDDCCSLFAVNEPKTKPRVYFTELEEAKCNDLEGLMDKAYQTKDTILIHEKDEAYL